MLQKILNIAAKVILGIFAFYLFLTAVLLPLGLWWGIPSQGTKILKHPVKVKSAYFNPFLWRLGIHGFQILDTDSTVMAGFDTFTLDVSFVSLLKKKYHVELVGLDGLVVNAALLPDGKVNLLSLVPEQPAAPEAAPSEPQALPLVFVDTIALRRGNIQFKDLMIAPGFSAGIADMDVTLSGFSTDPAGQTRISFKANLGGEGVVSTEGVVQPLAQPLALDTAFNLNSYALPTFTPYAGKYTGRAVADGKLDIRMDYRIAENKLTASHKILIQRFDFGEKIESKDALPLPFGLVVALLEDPSGRINISLPVTGDMSDPEFHYFHLIGQVARNFFMKIITKPFSFLASAIGVESGTDDLGYVNFAPGKADLSGEEKAKLDILSKGLKERPKISLEVNGSYDPEIDWKAIKTEVFQNDYAALRKESLKEEGRVYHQLYQRRFGVRDLWALTKKYKLKEGGYDEEKLNAEIKRQLIEEGSPDKLALEVLAQTRAQTVYDYFIASGVDAKRVSVGQLRPGQASMGNVPMEFTLTVFEDRGGTEN